MSSAPLSRPILRARCPGVNELQFRVEWQRRRASDRIAHQGDSLMTGNSHSRRRFAPVFCGCVALVLFASACGQQLTPDTRIADEATIRELDVKWAQAATAKNLEDTVSYYDDDASLLPPNTTIQAGKTAVHAAWAGLLGSVDSIAWQPNKIEVSRSSDLAYVIGVYQMTSKNTQGRSVTDHGKYVEVWKKQTNSSWKVVADIFNSDLLPPAPEPPAKKK